MSAQAQPEATPSRAGAASPSPVALTPLSAELRREMPPLAFGGSVYSDTASSRFVMVGGQLVREGEIAAPGVVVERIGAKSLVLRWRDLRIEWPL
jgi:general secretion pathway protein B